METQGASYKDQKQVTASSPSIISPSAYNRAPTTSPRQASNQTKAGLERAVLDVGPMERKVGVYQGARMQRV